MIDDTLALHTIDGDDIDMISLLGTEPEILAGHHDGAQAFRMCGDIIKSVKAAMTATQEDRMLTGQGVAQKNAQIVIDATKRLDYVAASRDALAKVVAGHWGNYAPILADEPAISAALWDKLPPNDLLQMETVYRTALENKDWRVCNAVETLTSLHENRLAPEVLVGLRHERLRAENPELADRVELVEEVVTIVERSHFETEEFLGGLGKIIDDENGVKILNPAPGP